MDLNPGDWRLGVTRGSGRGQVQYLLDEAPHGLVVHLGMGGEELVVQQLCVAGSLVRILVDTLRDEVVKFCRESLLG